MIVLHAKHLEPIQIDYNNQVKHILVTEDGSKFYSSDLVCQKSIDIVFQNMTEKDKEFFHLLIEFPSLIEQERTLFYLTEKEFNDYCSECSKYLESSNSAECRKVKKELVTKNGNPRFRTLADIEKMMIKLQIEVHSVCVNKLMKYWRTRATSNGKGVNGRVFNATMTVIGLMRMNIERGNNQLCGMIEYRANILNTGGKIALRIMCDKRSDIYDEWFSTLSEVVDVCSVILDEDGRREEKADYLREWMDYCEKIFDVFVTVKEFEKLFENVQIDKSRIVLVPDTHFIQQLTELPLRVDYSCTTIAMISDYFAYTPVQAQLRVFQMLACDIDWNRINKEQCENWRFKIIELMKRFKTSKLYSYDDVEVDVRNILFEPSFKNARKNMKIKTPLHICREKKFNEYMSMVEFKVMLDKYYQESLCDPEESGIDIELDEIAIWRVRYIFLVRWIHMFLYDHPQLIMNLMEALKMSYDFHMYNEDLSRYSIDFGKYKFFEEMIMMKDLEDQAENSNSDVKQDNPETSDERKFTDTEDEDATEERTFEVVAGNSDVSKYIDEILDLKRQLAEQTTLLEEQRNQTKRDKKQIQQLRKDLEESQKATETSKMEEKNAKEQAKKIKQDYKKTVQEQEQKMKKQNEHIEQLETHLKKIKENAKTESERTNMEAEKELKNATDKLKKKENELEKLKFTARMNSEELINLKKENNLLKHQIEINSDKDEIIQEVTKENEELKLENRRLLEDKCVKDQEVEFLKIENLKLKKENDQLSLTVATEMCHSSTSS